MMSSSGRGAVGTPLYMDSALAADGALCFASDVYSLGIMTWEVLVGRVPYTGVHPPAFLGLVMGGMRPPLDALPRDTPAVLRDALPAWWDRTQAARPTITDVAAVLDAALSSLP